MLQEFLDIVRARTSYKGLPDEKYKVLFKDDKLLMTVLNQEWCEEAYKQMCFLEDKVLCGDGVILNGYGITAPGMLPVYSLFQDYIFDFFSFEFHRFPFEGYGHLANEGIDLFKVLLKENKINHYKKDKR